MRYYIIAGERSGDLHGGNLVRSIRRHDPEAVFRGLGGDYLRQQGVDLFAHYSDLAVMGFVEVLLSIVKISRYLRKCGRDILDFKPDVIILIDYAGFNYQVARFGKKNNIKVFYYISPKVWAWSQRRAWHLKKNVDRMFVILPFEKDFFRKFNWEVDYVGNPVLDAVKAHQADAGFVARHGLDKSKAVVALLPGSRHQEVSRVLPVFRELVVRLPDVRFGVATVNNLPAALYESVGSLPNVVLVAEDTYNLLQQADAAVVTSGTATLETALFRVPQVVVYRAAKLTIALGRLVIRVPFISLVNLIAEREVVRELIQDDANAEVICQELNALISNREYRDRMRAGYDEIIRKLDTGSASENAGRLMVGYLKQ